MLADGVDVLFNPAGPASVRLTGDFMRETLMMDDEQVTALHAQHLQGSGLRVVPWEPFAGSTEEGAAKAPPRQQEE